MVARWSWPRFRFDQLMTMAWKVMLPLGLVNLVAVAVWAEYGRRASDAFGAPPITGMATCGWVVLVAAMLVTAALVPAMSENRPRR
jgi:NADH-quinone oxidoreductase subunit H